MDTKQSKYSSRESSYYLEVSPEDSLWNLRFQNTLRRNSVDANASRTFLANEIMPSVKQSVALEWQNMSEKLM
jgi:hypothetical protein